MTFYSLEMKKMPKVLDKRRLSRDNYINIHAMYNLVVKELHPYELVGV